MIKEELKPLYKRLIEISYKNRLSHLGSCITALPIIDEIYSIKKPDEKFVLSSGHAGLALYCVIEKYFYRDIVMTGLPDQGRLINVAEKIFAHHGVHPDRCSDCRIDCSSGSLGHGLPIAVGMALANRSKNVYCLISDGECSEGSIWEAFRIQKEQNLDNLIIYVNINGWGAYKGINQMQLSNQLEYMSWAKPVFTDLPPFLKGQKAHYEVIDEDLYKKALEYYE